MILNTGQRTDIPAFYWPWFINRLHQGYVLVRNPYYPKIVTHYEINSDVVDLISFCTKNPGPALKNMETLKPYKQYWFVTITPYGHDIEPNIIDKWQIMDSFRKLSELVGRNNIAWRYDPVFLYGPYTKEYHLRSFEKMCTYLQGSTHVCVISFIDLYEKTKKNFPGIQEVSFADQIELTKQFVQIAQKHGMIVRGCHESSSLSRYGMDTQGCFRKEIVQKAIGEDLQMPSGKMARQGCTCLLSSDIGAYNTCNHGCIYCYANYDMKLVHENMAKHVPTSNMIIGNLEAGDELHYARQKSWLSPQMKLQL